MLCEDSECTIGLASDRIEISTTTLVVKRDIAFSEMIFFLKATTIGQVAITEKFTARVCGYEILSLATHNIIVIQAAFETGVTIFNYQTVFVNSAPECPIVSWELEMLLPASTY